MTRVSALLALAGLALAQDPASRPQVSPLFETADGSRFLLVPTGGPPLVHWVWLTPAGVLEEPPGLEGVTHALARAAMTGTTAACSKDPEQEQIALDLLDRVERAAASVAMSGEVMSTDLRTRLERARRQAQDLHDRGAFARELAQVPIVSVRLSEHPEADLVEIAAATEGIERLARLLHAWREGRILRGVHEHLHALRTAALARRVEGPLATADEEILTHHFAGHPYARFFAAGSPLTVPLTQTQALNLWQQTHAPRRGCHVLVGGFDPVAVRTVLANVFASSALPRERAPRPAVPRDTKVARRSTIPGGREARLLMTWRLPRVLPDSHLTGLQDWLLGDEEAFLPRGLRTKGHPHVRVSGMLPYPGTRGDGLLRLEAMADPDEAGAVLAVDQVLLVLAGLLVSAATDGPSAADLARIRARASARAVELAQDPAARARMLALRLGLSGDEPEQALDPAPPDAATLRVLLQAILQRGTPAVVTLEAAR